MAQAWKHPEPARPVLGPEYGQWLTTLPWDWWGTFTFAEWIHPEWARQRYEDWARALADDTGKVQTHARALEYQRRGVVHFHALIWNVSRRTRKSQWEQSWLDIGGGWGQLRNYDRARGATYYLGKYLVKGGEVDMLRVGGTDWKPDDVRITQGGP